MTLWRMTQLILSALFDFRGHIDAQFRKINDKLDDQMDRLNAQAVILKSIQNAVEPSPAVSLQLTIGPPMSK